MPQDLPQASPELRELCQAIHDESREAFSGGRADWPVASLSADHRKLIQRAEQTGYVTSEVRMDLGADRIVIRLTPRGRDLLGVREEERRPSILERIGSVFRW